MISDHCHSESLRGVSCKFSRARRCTYCPRSIQRGCITASWRPSPAREERSPYSRRTLEPFTNRHRGDEENRRHGPAQSRRHRHYFLQHARGQISKAPASTILNAMSPRFHQLAAWRQSPAMRTTGVSAGNAGPSRIGASGLSNSTLTTRPSHRQSTRPKGV